VITAIKPKHTVLLRTHCDQVSTKHSKTVEKEIEEDYRILQKWGITGVKIYATSAKDINLFDNLKVRELLLKHPFDEPVNH